MLMTKSGVGILHQQGLPISIPQLKNQWVQVSLITMILRALKICNNQADFLQELEAVTYRLLNRSNIRAACLRFISSHIDDGNTAAAIRREYVSTLLLRSLVTKSHYASKRIQLTIRALQAIPWINDFHHPYIKHQEKVFSVENAVGHRSTSLQIIYISIELTSVFCKTTNSDFMKNLLK